jgi:hypothetical protein
LVVDASFNGAGRNFLPTKADGRLLLEFVEIAS